MALVIADRVRETTTTTGTGAVTLAGAYTSFQSFLAAVGNGNSTYYTIASAVTGEWEVGIGTYTSASNTLSRTTVLASSNAGSLVNFSSGAKDVFVTQPAERSILVQSAGSGLFSGVAAFTANGVPYANSTSTLTTGSALTFDGTNLAAAGRVRAGGTSALGLSNVFEAQNTSYGNLAAFRSIPGDGINPYLLITSSADGITLEENGSAYGALMFKTNASEQMRLTGTGLGIGASSFSSKLSVQTTDASAWSPNSTTGTQFIYNAGVLNSASATTHYQVIYGDATTGGVKAGAVASASYSADFVIANRNVGTYQENLRLTYNGNLGIGTSSPNKGSWSKALTLEGASNEAYELVTNGTYMGWFAAGGSSVTIGTKQANPFIFFTSDTERMRLDSSGNLGIGTSSPSAKLTVTDTNGIALRLGDISAAPVNQTAVYVGPATTALSGAINGDLVLIPRTSTTASITFWTGSTTAAERMRLDSSGNLGLGVTPSAWGGTYKGFQIGQGGLMSRTGGSDVYLLGNNYYDGTNFRYINTSFASRYQQDSGAHSWFTAPSGTAGNAISFTQAMTLDASGNLGIGTSSPAYKLDVTGQIRASVASGSAQIRLERTATTAGASWIGADADALLRVYTTGFSTQLMLDSSGNLGLGVTPSAWQANGKALEFSAGAIYSYLSGASGEFDYAYNAYFDGSWKYKASSSAASLYSIQAGVYKWFTAPSGTAGNAITFTQALTLNTNGALVLKGGDTSASGVGIAFPATQSASSNANTLDDYEEGTWTPVLNSTGTAPTVSAYSGQNGTYTKVGNMVTANCYVRATITNAGTGVPTVTGLPFAAGSGIFSPSVGLRNLLAAAPDAYLSSTESRVVLDGTTWAVATNNYICFTATYFV